MLLVNFILFSPNIRLRYIVFPWYFPHTFNFYTNCSTLFCVSLFSSQLFYLTLKKSAHKLNSSLYISSKLPTIDQTQQSTKTPISPVKSIYFQIIIKRLSYRLISIRNNRIYDLFIAEQSYEYKILNVSNIVRSFDILFYT